MSKSTWGALISAGVCALLIYLSTRPEPKGHVFKVDPSTGGLLGG